MTTPPNNEAPPPRVNLLCRNEDVSEIGISDKTLV
jgi:hypothetical protein